MFNKEVWKNGELLAQNFLKKKGYKIVGTNMKFAGVEVDVVAIAPKRILIKKLKQEVNNGTLLKSSFAAAKKQQKDTIVFVEVKARSNEKFGLPAEAVKENQKQRIRRFADNFIRSEKYKDFPVRFDIVSILNEKIEHFEGAF